MYRELTATMTDTSFSQHAIILGDYLLSAPSPVSPQTAIALKYFLNFIKKDVLVTFATEALEIGKIPKKTKKDDIITLVLETANHQQLQAFFADNADTLALHPTQLEEILACSKTERKRWTDEERLPVLYYEDFRYGSYPVYDLVATVALINQVSQWREEHEAKKAKRRKQAAQVAKTTRQETRNQREAKLLQLQSDKQRWGDLAALFELAYWAVAAHQLSENYREKVKRAKTKGDEYYQIASELDNLKISAIALLAGSQYTTLNFHFDNDYPPDIVWHQQGWTAYFEANIGKNDLKGIYILVLKASGISEKALFLIPSHQQERYQLPLPENLVPQEVEHPQPSYTFWQNETPLEDGKLFTPKQVTAALNRCLGSQNLQQLEAHREEKFSQLAQAAKDNRAETLEEQRHTVTLFRKQFQQRLQNRKHYWLTHFPQLSRYFELAEFTRWVSRAAKSLQEHNLFQRADHFYHLKNCAIAILNTCPLAKLTFYRPEYPDYGYYDYYEDHFVVQIKDYYSLFSTEIIVPDSSDPDDCFQFHTPYTIGKSIFPPVEDLEQVKHLEKEGRFRFGHPLTELEQLIFNPEEIEEKISALTKQFSAEEIHQRRQEKFSAIAKETREKRQRIKDLEAMEVFLTEGEETEMIAYFYEIAVTKGLRKSKALNWVRNQLKSFATCSENLQNYPEFSKSYFNKACKKRWSNQNLRNRLFK